MYRNCIFCAGELGSNEAIERFPVGRSVAFDAAKGRLWAVCPRCARWNLAPLEERWEAIEAGERLFRDTRLRAHSENVGLAQLRDGTRLISIGNVQPGEMAVVRYSKAYRRRHALHTAAAVGAGTVGAAGALIVAPSALVLISPLVIAAGCAIHAGIWLTENAPKTADRVANVVKKVADTIVWGAGVARRVNGMRPLESIPGERPGERISLTRADLRGARLLPAGEASVAVELPALEMRLEGWNAQALIARRLLHLNRSGGDERDLAACVRMITSLGGPAGCLAYAAGKGVEIGTGTRYHGVQGLAIEMALHEETERRALEGELAMLEAMWREAEEIAALADRLPDHLAPAEPPRIG